jgi:putative aldouronate transport system substrate-binding protein
MDDSQTLPHSSVDRRAFLRLASGGLAGGALLISACGLSNTAPPPAASGSASSRAAPSAAGAATTTPGSAAASTSAKATLPSYLPVQAAPPDLPSTPEGLDAGYVSYPKNLIKSVPQTPGSGGDVSVFTLLQIQPPPPIDQNPAWQAVNKDLNANMKMVMATTPDYPTKLATTMAGNDLPDLLYFLATVSVPDIPRFLSANYTDLTPHLGGDAVKDYPNLAAIPTLAWKQTVYNGAIYGVAVPRPFFQTIWYINQTRLDAVGGKPPTSGDEFKRMLQALTRPQDGWYGIAGAPQNAYGLTSTPQLAMFHVPNNWSVDANGKFTKDLETDQFQAALEYVRDLYASGVYHPDSPNYNTTSVKQNFIAGKYAVMATGWFSYQGEFWDPWLKLNPPQAVRTLHPFSASGGPGIWHQYQAYFGMTAVKKASAERVKELLRILNYMAAPFGSQESMLLEYGVQDADYTLDEKGSPIPTPQGVVDTGVSWRYLTMRPQVLFDPNDANFARVAYADEQTMVPVLIADPSLGLYAPTQGAKGNVLTQNYTDALAEIVVGRSPVSNLDQIRKDWRSGGGDQIRGEMEQAYAAAKA